MGVDMSYERFWGEENKGRKDCSKSMGFFNVCFTTLVRY
tara:strand:+ start:161 stop:277 length:117 start_codon:yes stop_codon:yes gene_type:complete